MLGYNTLFLDAVYSEPDFKDRCSSISTNIAQGRYFIAGVRRRYFIEIADTANSRGTSAGSRWIRVGRGVHVLAICRPATN